MICRVVVVAALSGVLTPLVAQTGMPAWREAGWCSYHHPVDKPPPPRMNLPDWACEATYAGELQRRYTPDTRMNPFFISGDFNGDGKIDIAIWVTNNMNRKLGILFLAQGQKEPFVAGAGSDTEDRGDDYTGFDVWSLIKKGEVLDSVYESRQVQLRGDAIIVEKSESAAVAIYWDGKRYAFYQVSD